MNNQNINLFLFFFTFETFPVTLGQLQFCLNFSLHVSLSNSVETPGMKLHEYADISFITNIEMNLYNQTLSTQNGLAITGGPFMH